MTTDCSSSNQVRGCRVLLPPTLNEPFPLLFLLLSPPLLLLASGYLHVPLLGLVVELGKVVDNDGDGQGHDEDAGDGGAHPNKLSFKIGRLCNSKRVEFI